MWKAGVSVWSLIMETRETIPVRCAAECVCVYVYWWLYSSQISCFASATVENPLKQPENAHTKRTQSHLKLAKTHTRWYSATVSQILMFKTTAHINIKLSQHIQSLQTLRGFSWDCVCENSQFRAGLLIHFKCHMKQLMTHRVMVYLARESVCLYIIIMCKANITRVMMWWVGCMECHLL